MSRADEFLLTAEELRLRRRKRRRLFVSGIGIALLLVIGFFAARPARDAIKSWQSRRHAHRAFEFLAQEKWNDAQKEAVAAYQLWPNEPEALRAVARFLSRTRQPQALEFWAQLAKNQPLARDDLRDEATSALVAGEVGRAAAAIKQLIADKEARPADWLLAAQLALQSGVPNDAETALQHIFASPATTSREQLQAAVLELRAFGSASEEDRPHQTDAWQRISKLATGQDEIALDSLVLLAQRILSTPTGGTGSVPSQTSDATADVPPTPGIVRALETHPLAKAPHKLLAIDLRMLAEPADKEALLTRAIADWHEADAISLVALATWLNGHGEYQRELDTIPLERALQTRELFLQRLDALGALGQWAEIKRLLQNENFPLDPVIEHMYLARCNQQLGEITAGENNWQRALEAAANDPQKLLVLADYAAKNGATNIAETAYDTITHDSPGVRVAQQGRLRLAQQRRDTRKIHAVLAEMLKHWPNDTAIQNDEAYTRLLLAGAGKADTLKSETLNGNKADIAEGKPQDGQTRAALSPPITNNDELITVERLAERLVQQEPASLPHRTLLALARLKQGRSAAALEIYIDLRVPSNAASPSAVAVHAAVLAGSGREEDARTEAGAVNWEQLLPEEQALIETLR